MHVGLTIFKINLKDTASTHVTSTGFFNNLISKNFKNIVTALKRRCSGSFRYHNKLNLTHCSFAKSISIAFGDRLRSRYRISAAIAFGDRFSVDKRISLAIAFGDKLSADTCISAAIAFGDRFFYIYVEFKSDRLRRSSCLQLRVLQYRLSSAPLCFLHTTTAIPIRFGDILMPKSNASPAKIVLDRHRRYNVRFTSVDLTDRKGNKSTLTTIHHKNIMHIKLKIAPILDFLAMSTRPCR